MAKTDFIQTYQLKQQTPMIHFQSAEEGATLRASEVKPKLDRFLLTQLGEGDYERGIAQAKLNAWFMGDSHDKDYGKPPALNYKIRFIAKGEPATPLPLPHKLYFGNMGLTEAEKRKTTFYAQGVELKIVCFNDELQRCIKTYLPSFFALHAFGTRSGKGFGCFSVEHLPLDTDLLKTCCPLKTYYSITYPAKQSATSFLNDVWVISGMMKSGFNFTFHIHNPNDYYKGHIFRYYTSKNIGGDKAFIKQKVLKSGKDANLNSEENARYPAFRFIRAMLGLPGGFEFRSGQKTTRRGNVNVQSDDIERFQSPVHYHILDNKLLIIPQIIPDRMLNAIFSLNGQSINTPANFDLIDFLDSFCLRFNARADISQFQSNEVRNTLISNTRLHIGKVT